MQKKRNIFLAFSLGFLVLTSAGLMLFTQDDNRFAVDRESFKIPDSEKIDRVVLASSTGTVELKFENNHWRVNDQWDADVQMIKVLFATLRQAEPRRPVATRWRDSVSQKLEHTGIRVTVFEGAKKRSAFLAGGNALKTEAWFVKEGDTQPYLMMIPGYRVYVAGILELDADGWRSKRIFDFNWRNFRSLLATYPKEPRQDFEVELKDQYFGIKNLAEVDTAKLNTYLDVLSLLFAKRFVPAVQPGMDSLKSTSPLVRIQVRDIASRYYGLELFAPRKNETEIFGRLANGQWVTLDRNAVREIVKKRDYFRP